MDNLDIRITELEFIPIPPQQGLIGFVKIILNDCYLLEGMGVYICQERNGYRITYPKRKSGTKSITLHYPTTPEVSKYIEQAVNEEVARYYDNLVQITNDNDI